MAARSGLGGPAVEGAAPRGRAGDGAGDDAGPSGAAGLAAGGSGDAGTGDDDASDAGDSESSAESCSTDDGLGAFFQASRKKTRQLRKEKVANHKHAPSGAAGGAASPGAAPAGRVAGTADGSPQPAAGEGEPAETRASEEPADGSAEDSASVASGSEEGCSTDDGLGSFFKASKKKKLLRKPAAKFTAPPQLDGSDVAEEGGGGPAAAETPRQRLLQPTRPEAAQQPATPSFSSSTAPPTPSPSRSCWPQPPCRLPSFSLDEDAEEEEDEPTSMSAAASRNAWKQRGMDSCRTRTSTEDTTRSFKDEESGLASAKATKKGVGIGSADGGVPRRKKKVNATGMYRAVPGMAADATRCHWLIPPESLAIRMGQEAGSFLIRMWLALHASANAGRGGGGPQKKKKFPARLHAGWLAQTLRPKGWLAPIPEDEVRNLPMPEELISEPDRGPQRPCAAAVEKVILRELAGVAIGSG